VYFGDFLQWLCDVSGMFCSGCILFFLDGLVLSVSVGNMVMLGEWWGFWACGNLSVGSPYGELAAVKHMGLHFYSM